MLPLSCVSKQQGTIIAKLFFCIFNFQYFFGYVNLLDSIFLGKETLHIQLLLVFSFLELFALHC